LPSLSWGTLAEDHGFLVVWPQGLVFPNPQVPLPEPVVRLAGFVSATWNDGTGIFGAEANGVDDVGFLLKLVAALQTDGRVDSTRIYLSGHSNGALMAQRFALQTENLVAGVLAFSGGGQPNDPLWQPGGSYVADEYRPTPILFVHGTADAVVPFSKRWGPLAGAVPSLRGWALINGCADNATITEFSEEGYAHHRYDTCSDGVAVHLLEVQGAGHHPFTRGEEPFLLSTHNVIADCPFRRIPFFSEVDCLLHDLDTTALAWDFVSSFQLSL
jgi:poly(3-hydroxybutyrate) depolymerase